ncbi:MAG: hypothetical protein ACREX8_18220 [Gammaproteobacteria bacterium]
MFLIVALILLLVAVVCIAVGAAAATRRSDRGPHPLEWLMNLRSPSGKQFFADQESARELLDAIEDPELTSPDRDRRPSA